MRHLRCVVSPPIIIRNCTWTMIYLWNNHYNLIINVELSDNSEDWVITCCHTVKHRSSAHAWEAGLEEKIWMLSGVYKNLLNSNNVNVREIRESSMNIKIMKMKITIAYYNRRTMRQRQLMRKCWKHIIWYPRIVRYYSQLANQYAIGN